MKNIILTSCGIINDKIKTKFYEIIKKEEIHNKKVLYITTASDGENGDKSWMNNEYKTIINLGFDENSVNMRDFTGLKIVDGIIIPHANRKEEFINKIKGRINDKLYLLYDEDGIILKKDERKIV